MFINLTARKPNGDFYITSSDVLLDQGVPADKVRYEIYKKALGLNAEGFEVKIDEREEV